MCPYQNGNVSTSGFPWSAYRAAFRLAAASDPTNVGVIDLGERMYTSGSGDILGMFADATHPNDNGHSWLADIMVQALLPR